MAATEHTIKRGAVNGPMTAGAYWAGHSSQHYARCTCNWMHVAVTPDSLTMYVNGHLAQVTRDTDAATP